jgi:hypothetical protein
MAGTVGGLLARERTRASFVIPAMDFGRGAEGSLGLGKDRELRQPTAGRGPYDRPFTVVAVIPVASQSASPCPGGRNLWISGCGEDRRKTDCDRQSGLFVCRAPASVARSAPGRVSPATSIDEPLHLEPDPHKNCRAAYTLRSRPCALAPGRASVDDSGYQPQAHGIFSAGR